MSATERLSQNHNQGVLSVSFLQNSSKTEETQVIMIEEEKPCMDE